MNSNNEGRPYVAAPRCAACGGRETFSTARFVLLGGDGVAKLVGDYTDGKADSRLTCHACDFEGALDTFTAPACRVCQMANPTNGARRHTSARCMTPNAMCGGEVAEYPHDELPAAYFKPHPVPPWNDRNVGRDSEALARIARWLDHALDRLGPDEEHALLHALVTRG